MVTRIVFLLGLIAVFATACGSGGDDAPAATATRAPTIGASASTSTPSGPNAAVEPRSGPPGIVVTVRGSGWEPGVLIDLTGELAPGATADGAQLSTGRYNLIARSPANQVTIPFLVETRRPIGGSGPQG